MVDFFLGETPTAHNNKEQVPFAIQMVLRDLLRIARSAKLDKRGKKSERRRSDPGIVVELSHDQERNKRKRLERRNSYGHLRFAGNHNHNDRRKIQLDRRKLVNDGIYLSLKSKGDRRSPRDRRG